jgi:hypothetical protein
LFCINILFKSVSACRVAEVSPFGSPAFVFFRQYFVDVRGGMQGGFSLACFGVLYCLHCVMYCHELRVVDQGLYV